MAAHPRLLRLRQRGAGRRGPCANWGSLSTPRLAGHTWPPPPRASKWRGRLRLPSTACIAVCSGSRSRRTGRASAHAAQYAAGAARSADWRPKLPKAAGSEPSARAWPASSSRTSPKHFPSAFQMASSCARAYAADSDGGIVRRAWFARADAHIRSKSQAHCRSGECGKWSRRSRSARVPQGRAQDDAALSLGLVASPHGPAKLRDAWRGGAKRSGDCSSFAQVGRNSAASHDGPCDLIQRLACLALSGRPSLPSCVCSCPNPLSRPAKG